MAAGLARAEVALPFSPAIAAVCWLDRRSHARRTVGDEELSVGDRGAAGGLHHPAAGSVTRHGIGLGSPRFLLMVAQFLYRYLWIRRKVGLVFQDSDSQLFMPTVLEEGPLARSIWG